MDIFEKFATDEKKEIEGTKVYIGDGCSIVVARAGNSNYDNMLIKTTEANREALDKGDANSKELDRKLFLEIMATTILLGWSGLKYKGKSMKYSVKNAVTLLAHRDFRNLVVSESSKLSNFSMKAVEADEKN